MCLLGGLAQQGLGGKHSEIEIHIFQLDRLTLGLDPGLSESLGIQPWFPRMVVT